MYPRGLSLCHVWRFQSFWFYRADRQTDRITEADDRYTHVTTIGVSNEQKSKFALHALGFVLSFQVFMYNMANA